MTERPILFSGPMVRALLDGSKTQTRRVVKHQPPDDVAHITVAHYEPTVVNWRGEEEPGSVIFGAYSECGSWGCKCPYGKPGDRLWVRETFQGPMWEEGTWDPDTDYHKPEFCEYRADGGPMPEYVDFEDNLHQGWKPSIHMPRWASRITLEVTGVRVERLQDISRGDAMDEGCPFPNMATGDDPRQWFAGLWSQINGAESWDANPWVWVVEFNRINAAPPVA